MKNLRYLLLIFLLPFLLFGCTNFPIPTKPIFTDPATKIITVTSPIFVDQLMTEGTNLNPNLVTNGTQAHMGYWSVYTNRQALVNVLDSINSTRSTNAQIGIWDEGVNTQEKYRYPAYIRMDDECWYDRANAIDNRVTINGVVYVDPHPVTFVQADEIWGQYSQRYAEMAIKLKQKTGNVVKVWCFVEGAKKNRIFFSYEFPKLVELENQGVVRVFFAQNTSANWTNPSDWKEGTKNAPTPVAASAALAISRISTKTNILETAIEIANAYRDGYYGTGDLAKKAAIQQLMNSWPNLQESDYTAVFAKALHLTAF
ncbi:MAG: hypothetical protein WC860_05930 [Candidatus Margulisiibacteriota bacterium]|jgi:hypothetical protein